MKKPVVNLKQRKVLLPLIAGALLIAVVGGFFIWKDFKDNSQNASNKVVCNDSIIKRGSEALAANDKQALAELKPEITALKDYDKDQSCLYLLISNSLQFTDSENAKKYLESLKKVYKDGGYSKAFVASTQTLPQLEKSVATLDEYITESKDREQRYIDRQTQQMKAADDYLEAQNR